MQLVHFNENLKELGLDFPKGTDCFNDYFDLSNLKLYFLSFTIGEKDISYEWDL